MTGCDRILQRLERGPATAAELYADTYCIVHSRIADLRRRGHNIACERVENKTGAESYRYTLIPAGTPPDARLTAHEGVLAGSTPPSVPQTGAPLEQLSLEAA